MFIYIKSAKGQKSSYVINRVAYNDIFYYEICFRSLPSPYDIRRALRHCDRRLPIVYEGRLLRRESARRMDTEAYNLQLLINAFSFVSARQKKALVIDPDGSLCDKIALPLTAVRTLYVFTNRADIYARAGEHHLRKIGTSPVLLDKRIDIGEYPTLLSPYGYCELERSHPFVFGQNGFLPTGDLITARHRIYERLLSAALYSLCEDKISALSLPLTLCRDGRTVSLDSLKVRLDSLLRNSI